MTVEKRVLAALAALPMWLAGVAFAASPAAEGSHQQQTTPTLEELGEVIVSGERPVRSVQELIPWIRRLLGEYTIEGYVDVGGRGDPDDRKSVRGTGLCAGFGEAPGVQCELRVGWPPPRPVRALLMPASASAMMPVMILYGVEPDELGIRYLQVDARGLAEGATGVVVGDSAAFKAACVDMPDGCERITRITAKSDSKQLDMQIDTVVNGELEVRYRFQLTRVAEPQAERTAGEGKGGGMAADGDARDPHRPEAQ